MKYTEWLAETKRLSDEIAAIVPECKRLQDIGDWSSVSVVQTTYYALRRELAELAAREPSKTGPQVSDRDVTLEEWREQADWISHDLGSVEIEWNVFRRAGDWSGAQDPQQRYHELRARQAAHDKRKPKTATD